MHFACNKYSWHVHEKKNINSSDQFMSGQPNSGQNRKKVDGTTGSGVERERVWKK